MSTRETEAQVDPGISNFQTIFTSIGARCDVMYLIKVRTALCHMLFLPISCVRRIPVLIRPPRDAGDNFFWFEPLHTGMYYSLDICICMYRCIGIPSLGMLHHDQTGIDVPHS
jgi:hypothetical protein